MMSSFGSLLGIFVGFMVLLWFLWLAVMIGAVVFWIVMIVDVIQRKFPKKDDKTLWILIVVLAGVIGAIVYYFMVKKKEKKK